MDIVGIGTDIVECVRVGKMIEQHGELFLRRIYTEREIHFCQARKRATEHFAARWAAKEAILKCLGTGWRRGLSWTDLEVRSEAGGKHQVVLTGAAREIAQARGISIILLSLGHCRAYATAQAIAIRGPLGTPRES
jgi:holo-[acyl-carrier protein] synthase